MPPIAGPMTRDAFMLTELSDTAPARSLRGTRVGVSDRKAGDWRAAPVPMKATAKRNSARDGLGFSAIQARNSEPTSCSTLSHRMSLRRSKVSASAAADHRQQQLGAEVGEAHEADEPGAPGDGVGHRRDDDVLHPAADVRREHPEEEGAEVAVAQGGADGADLGRAVAVEEGVLGLLEDELRSVVVGGVGPAHRLAHGAPRVRPSPPPSEMIIPLSDPASPPPSPPPWLTSSGHA